MKPTLIQLKKQIYYLLLNIPENDIMDNEKLLLSVLQDDLELQAEICYTEYMEGE